MFNYELRITNYELPDCSRPTCCRQAGELRSIIAPTFKSRWRNEIKFGL